MSFGHPLLTPREQQIINAILHGHTSKALASELGISVETVKLHRKNAYRKLAVRNQTELFHTFIQTLKEQHPESVATSAAIPTRS
jgi:DNA-binding NarL/FixJ family response regulator